MNISKTKFMRTKVIERGVIYHINKTNIHIRFNIKDKTYHIRIDGKFKPFKAKTKKQCLQFINDWIDIKPL